MKNQYQFSQGFRRHSTVLAVLLLVGVTILPSQPAVAASSWSPTLLVNTESFQVIDDGDGSTDIELRFGTSANEKIYWNKAADRFQFTDDVHVEGNISGSGTLATDGDITTKANLTINSDNGAADAVLTFGNTVAKTLKYDTGDTRFEFDDDVYITGGLQTTGNVTVGTTITIGGVAYTFPAADGSASGKVLKTDGAGQLSWSTDIDTNTNAQTICGTNQYLDGDGNCVDVIEEAEMDSMSELETQVGSVNIITSGEIDSEAELEALLSDVTNVYTNNDGDLYDTAVADERYVNQSGDTMTGNLVIGNNATLSVSGAIITEGNLTINEDNSDADAVLTFGNDAGAKTLTYSNANTRFEFNDDVQTTGNLSGSTLTIDGAFTWRGQTYNAPTSQMENGYLKTDGAGNLTWAESVLGNGSGSIISLHPEYPNAVYFSSGSTFIGQLTASGGVAGVYDNYYHWTSSKATIQDYWISVRVRLPDNFGSWDPVKPIELRYRTADGTAGNNHVTLRMRDTANALVTLSGNAGLANASFTTANITLTGGTWAPKGYITIYVKLAALTAKFAEAGFLNLNFETTTP